MSTLQGSLRAVVAASALVAGTPAIAAQAGLNLPAAALPDALNALSRAAGVEILADPALLRGKTAPAIRRAPSAEAALVQLLRGSGLTYERRGGTFLIVRQAARPREPVAAAPVRRAAPSPATPGRPAPPRIVDGGEIIVTGSHIARPETESIMPVRVIRMEEAARAGRVTAYDALMREPGVAAGIGLNNAYGQAWDAGVASVSLRDLGVNRSLTLIDGMRYVSGSARSSAVDLNMVPTAMIDRIEVVTGGAAAIYGADAVTGAVNIITKRDIGGLHLSAINGISQRGDAAQSALSLSAGGKLAGGRGTFSIGGTYVRTAPLFFADRFDKFPVWVANPENTGLSDGISDQILIKDYRAIYYSYEPNFYYNGTSYILNNGSLEKGYYKYAAIAGEFSYGDGGNGRALADHDQIRGALDQLGLIGRADYAIADRLEYEAQFNYGRTRYSGPGAYQNSVYRDDSRSVFLGGAGGSVATLDNPYLPAAIRQFMLQNGLSKLNIDRAWGNFPIITEMHHRENFTLGQTLRGELPGGYRWNLFYRYGRTTDNVATANIPYRSHWIAGRDAIADPVTGQPVCRDPVARAAGCVPFDIFGAGPPTAAQKAYLLGTRHEKRINTQHVYGGTLTGKPLSLPYGEVSIALGFEHRSEALSTRDDPLAKQGELAYTPTPAIHNDIRASLGVSEAYGEVLLPLLRGLPLAHNLEIEGAYRYSDYSLFGGTHTWKAGGTWSPVRGLTFRGVRSRSVRVPNFGELYEPATLGAVGFIPDPCKKETYYASAARAANCAASGAPPLENYSPGPLITTGGNPALRPEISNSLTLGVIVQPRLLRGLDFIADYWDVNIRDVIAQFNYITVMNLCVDLPTIDNAFCHQVDRDANGHATAIRSTQINASRMHARGVDFGMDYRTTLGRGALSLSFKGTYLLDQVIETTPGIAVGNVKYAGGWQNPRFKGAMLTSYDLGKFGVAIDTRFIGASKYDVNAISPEVYADNHVPPTIYNDIIVNYKIAKTLRLGLGVKNATNRRAPNLPAIYIDNTVYDAVGRYFYSTINVDF